MKKLTFTIVALILSLSSFVQTPQAFKYQTVIRDNAGEIIASQAVSFRTSILEGSTEGSAVYVEIFELTTNELGLVSLEIGNGDVVSGVFADINWGGDSYFLQIELDETGNTNFQLMGISQLLSVPYALNSGSLTLTSPGGANYEVTVDDDGNLITSCFPMPSIAYTGPDQTNATSPATLEANTPDSGTGLWSIVSGIGGIIAEPSNPTSSFSGTLGVSYTLLWTIKTTCDSTNDEVVIFFAPVIQSCPELPSFIYEGQTYNTVLIGSQCWMKENLNIGTRIDGSGPSSDDGIIEKYCYNDDEDSCDVYGGLYQWSEAMLYSTTPGVQGICPPGWHIPTDDEWKILEGTVDSQYPVGDPIWDEYQNRGFDVGLHLKSTSGWWYDDNGTDLYGFTVLPAGRLNGYAFYNIGTGSDFMSSTENDYYSKLNRVVYHSSDKVLRSNSSYQNGASLRCLKD